MTARFPLLRQLAGSPVALVAAMLLALPSARAVERVLTERVEQLAERFGITRWYDGLLGWSLTHDRDVFSQAELVAAFDVANVNPNPARFDPKKCLAINSEFTGLLAKGDEDEASAARAFTKDDVSCI